MTHLVRVDLSSWFKESGITEVGAMIGGRAEGETIIIRKAGWGGLRFGWNVGRLSRASRALVLVRLVQVAFDHRNGVGRMFAKQGRGEAREVGDETFLQSQVKGG